jgi:ribosomal protein S13
MSYFLKTYIPGNKKIKDALVLIYGIGKKQASFICQYLGFQEKMYFNNLSRVQLLLLKKYIESNFTIGFDLKQENHFNIRELVALKTYRGNRH